VSAREPTATVAVRVDVAPARAFELFVHEIDHWWRRGPEFRHSGAAVGALRIEPRLHGAITETWPHAGGERTFELGRVTVWEPPARFAFTWRNATFAPHELTDVEVTFTATGRATLVTVRHRGYEALREDHPARHGMDDAALQRAIGLWWGRLLSSLREFAAAGA
jgi:uncharacterized protein YndB with AHSA1/START domain